MKDWISVKDGLPVSEKIVIVHGGVAYYSNDTKEWYTITATDWPGRPIEWRVTHWMPLPKPPIEKENG